MTTPVVSILTPVYNGAAYLGDTVRSVLAQTFTSWEHIFIDDGSSDDSISVIEKTCDPQRSRIIRHDRNLGIPAARNTALKASAGRYIALLDQDDLWTTSKLDRQLRMFDGDTGLCFGRHAFFRTEGDTIGLLPAHYPIHAERIEDMDKGRFYSFLFKENFIGAGSVVAEKALLVEAGGFDDRIRGGGDDYDLWLRLAGMTRFSMLPDMVLFSRIHSENYTNTITMTDDILKILRNIAEHVDIEKDIVSERFAAIHYKRFRAFFAKRDYSAAAEELRRSASFAGPSRRHSIAGMLVRMGGPGRSIFFGLRGLLDRSREAGTKGGRRLTLSPADLESVLTGETNL